MIDESSALQKFTFINKKTIDLDIIRNAIMKINSIDETVSKEILNNLTEIVGNQEIEWISKNSEDKIAEYILYRYKFKNYPKQRQPTSFPLHLLIEPTSICNLKCVMCFQQDNFFRKKENRIKIDFDFFTDLVDQAQENDCKALTLASRGEPLLHKEFGKMLHYCKDKFLELKINTNAIFLDETISRDILDAGVDIVIFSVDGSNQKEYEQIRIGGKFEKVVENIRLFNEIRQTKKECDKTVTRIEGIYFNQDMKEFLTFWKPLVDSVALDPETDRKNTYTNKIVEYNKPCDWLWERMYVWADGKCNPCDSDYRSTLIVGNAKENSLKEIWVGEDYTRLRNKHIEGSRNSIKICNRCGVI